MEFSVQEGIEYGSSSIPLPVHKNNRDLFRIKTPFYIILPLIKTE